MSCTYCGLHKTATTVLVPFRGQLRKPKILFVGIAPGPQEDQEGRNFIGASGECLKQLLTEVGISEDDVAFDNVVHCFPKDELGGIRDPNIDEIMTCSPYLYKAIKIADPTVIVTLGRLPWQVLTGRWEDTVVSEFRGQAELIPIGGKFRKVVGTYHPSASVRQGKKRGPAGYYDRILEDIQYAWDHANGKYYLPKWRIINDTHEAIYYIEEAVRRFRAGDIKFTALDTETPQLILKPKERKIMGIEMISSDIWRSDKHLLGFSMAYIPPEVNHPSEVEGVYIPMRHPESKVDATLVGYTMKWATCRYGEVKMPLAFHNHKYDAQWMIEKVDSNPINFHDTMLGSFVYYGSSRSHGLGGVSHHLLKYEIFKDDTEELLEQLPMDKRSFEFLPLLNLGRRGAIDAAATATLTEVERRMLEKSGQMQITNLMNEFSEACAEMEWRGASIDKVKHSQHMIDYPLMMDQAKERLENLPMVARYISDRRNIWTYNKHGKVRAPDSKFVFNPNSPDHKYELLYFYYNLPRDSAEAEAKTVENDDGSESEVMVYSTNENSRHPMTLHCRDTVYDGSCSCRCHVPGWETFRMYDSQYQMMPELFTEYISGSGYYTFRSFEYHTPQNYKQYGIDPHKECLSFLTDIRLWSKLRKIYNDYMVKIQHYFRPLEWQQKHQIPDTLRVISFNYILHYTKTGRLSTRDWAVHTEPWHSDVRRLHVSRWKDWGGLMLSADYSQLEVRAAAAIAKDEKLIQLYRDKADVHRYTAASVYRLPQDQVNQAMRRYAKTMTFRLIYGGGAQSIADETGLPLEEAQKLIIGFLETYTGIDRSIKNFHSFVKRFGYILTPMNRIFHIPEIWSDEKSKQAKALRDSQNYPIQSSSSDVTITAACIVRRYLQRTGMHSFIWALIHDAIENDLFPGELLAYYLVLKQAMEDEVCQLYDWLCVPMVAEFELGVRWDGALSVKDLDKDKMIIKGRRGFFEETMDVMSRAYKFDYKIKKEVYVGMHRGCGGEIDVTTHKCSKCDQQTRGLEDLDAGETLILRKSYEGDTGGTTDLTAEIEWRQHLVVAV